MIKTTNETKRSIILTRSSRVYQIASKILIRSIPYIPSNTPYNITICHEKNFLWFRVAKVGTRTIFNVFDQAKLKLDADHPMNCYYPPNLYRGYFKFAFVRNPWDRLVSCWINKVVNTNLFNFSDSQLLEMRTFRNFVKFVESQNIEDCDPHLRLQQKFIDLNNVDFVGRFENFEEDLSKTIKFIGIESVTIPHKNASAKRLHYREYYEGDLTERVAEIYRKDINIFHYDF